MFFFLKKNSIYFLFWVKKKVACTWTRSVFVFVWSTEHCWVFLLSWWVNCAWEIWRIRRELESKIFQWRGGIPKLGWGQIPWRWRHLRSDVYVNRVNQYQPPPQGDVIQSCRKNALSWLRRLLAYCGNIYILTNSNQKLEYCSTVGIAWSGSWNLSQCGGNPQPV